MVSSGCIEERSPVKLLFLMVQESELLHIGLNTCNKLEGMVDKGSSSRHLIDETMWFL